MGTWTRRTGEPRVLLTRERVLQVAMKLADQDGLESLSMRKLGQHLGVGPMALYYHFANKAEVVDGLVDLVFSEIEVPSGGGDWKAEMRERAISLHDALLRHRWAIGLMESRRRPGPASLRHHDAVIGSLRAGGLDIDEATHAYWVLNGYIYGFALTKLNPLFETSEEVVDVAQGLPASAVDEYPKLAAMIEHARKPDYGYRDEFEFGLDLILDGLGRALAT